MLHSTKLLRFSYPKTFTKSIFFTVYLLFMLQNLNAQLHVDFSDEHELTNEHWVIPENKFIIQNGVLQLHAEAVAGSASISLPSPAIQAATWEFYVRLNFNPSSTNYARVYLTSNESDLRGLLNGYYIMIGNTADEVSLYRQTGLTRTKIIDGSDGVLNVSTVEVKIMVTRDVDGQWTLSSDVGNTGQYVLEGTVFDDQHLTSTYFGIYCNYTATRSSHFFYDDITISGQPYVEPPKAQYKQIIITEMMVDPTPTQGLPEVEYVELYNRSDLRFNLAGYQLTDGNTTSILSAYTVEPNQYVLLTSQSLLAEFGLTNSIGLTNWPSLNNAGDQIVLKTPEGLIVDSILYTDRWFASSIKREGGWSLELIDIENICGEEKNWAESESDLGGTPGKQNSINANKPDTAGPILLSAIVSSPTVLLLSFDEKLENKPLYIQNITITQGIEITEVNFIDQSLRTVEVRLAQPLQLGVVYSITCSGIRDCAGNYIQPEKGTAQLLIPQAAIAQDVIINEILFNPKPGGVDFVEIYNQSEKYINLKNWKIANYQGEEITNSRIVIQQDYILPPHTFHVFTSNTALVKGEFISADESLMLSVTLPPLPDDAGSIALWNTEDVLIDHFQYTKNYHSVFMRQPEGVSLERISMTAPTLDPNNWKSASADRGYGTPTQINSQQRSSPHAAEKSIAIQPEIFWPGFGKPDFTEIHYAFDQGGYMANIKIVDAEGREIKHILNNGWLGATGFIRWDGDRNDGTPARQGYYMVWIELFDQQGIVKTIRKRVAIASPH